MGFFITGRVGDVLRLQEPGKEPVTVRIDRACHGRVRLLVVDPVATVVDVPDEVETPAAIADVSIPGDAL